jgi:hypothetical protein
MVSSSVSVPGSIQFLNWPRAAPPVNSPESGLGLA